MKVFVLDHLEGCSPRTPCASCKAISFLRPKLSVEDLDKFLALVREASLGNVRIPIDSPVGILGLSKRTINAARKEKNIITIRGFVETPEAELAETPGLGRQSIHRISKALANVGWRIGEHAGEVRNTLAG